MTIPVQRCCQAAELALKLGRADEAAALCQHVLDHHRWHLQAHILLGQAFLEQAAWTQAGQRFKLVQLVYPECAEVYSGWAIIALAQGDMAGGIRHLARAFENAPESDESREALQQALSQQAGRPVPTPAFTPACLGRFYLRRGLAQPAAEAYAAALRDDADRQDCLLAYATALWHSGLREQAANIYLPFLQQTPRPLTALLLAAAEKYLHGESEIGRQFWGEAHAWDPEHSHARTVLGPYYRQLPTLKAVHIPPPFDDTLLELIDMAAQVARELEPASSQSARELAAYAQKVSTGTPKGLQPADPQLRQFQSSLEQVRSQLFGAAGDQPDQAWVATTSRQGQRPAEVILSWEEGLKDRFGLAGARQVDQVLQNRARAAETKGFASRVVYLDRPPYSELPQPDPQDPQQIKGFLDALDQRLVEEGLDFGQLFIIGGPQVVPFALLPNPSEDTDEQVPSDNLYASRDPTYLIPERAVGRLPDHGTGDPSSFLEQLRQSTERLGRSNPMANPVGCLGLLWPWLELLLPWQRGETTTTKRFGLSAQVWAQASQAVFEALPGRERLRLCPPTCRDGVQSSWLAHTPLAYFNLHGAADSPHWYGQRDLAASGEGELMPIAFSPQHVPAGQVGNTVVYTEACYGAHILGKDAQSSIALRFLSEGALGFIGSTVISYGISQPPLTDADLLGLLFWQHLLSGKSTGESLLQAKIDFTREMYQRQGYLDGDDMKTLIQFVLYGDPLSSIGAQVTPSSAHSAALEIPAPPVLCEKHAKAVAVHQLSGELVARVRRSLTWLQQGTQVYDMNVSLQSSCPGGQCAGTCKSHAQAEDSAVPEALIFTSRREVKTEDGLCIPQLARVVVDTRGRIVKMAVTR